MSDPANYKKRTYKKRKTVSKAAQRGASRGQVYGAAAGQLYKDVQMLKNMINVEYKVQDTSTALQNVSTVPTLQLFNGLLRGDDFNQRNGRSVKWTSIYQRITVQAPSTATLPHFCRYMLFWVKDPSATAPTSLQIFGAATPSSINVMLNLNVRKDFIILYDEIMQVNPVNGGPSNAFRNIYKKCNMHTIFNAGNAGSIADIESGALYALWFSDTNTAGEQPQITLQSRCRYIDN